MCEKDTVQPLLAFLPVSMHLRPDLPWMPDGSTRGGREVSEYCSRHQTQTENSNARQWPAPEPYPFGESADGGHGARDAANAQPQRPKDTHVAPMRVSQIHTSRRVAPRRSRSSIDRGFRRGSGRRVVSPSLDKKISRSLETGRWHSLSTVVLTLAAFTGAATAIFWNLEVSWPAAKWLLEPEST